MKYSSSLRFAEKLDEGLEEYRALKKRRMALVPSEIDREKYDVPAVYRVTLPAGRVREYRDWKWVARLASAIKSGRNTGGIQPRDIVEFICENNEKQGNEIASLLRRADRGIL
jgi:hypothetical protein